MRPYREWKPTQADTAGQTCRSGKRRPVKAVRMTAVSSTVGPCTGPPTGVDRTFNERKQWTLK